MSGGPARRAVLFDFGGVLTSSVLDGFAAFSRAECGDPGLLLRVLGEDVEAKQVLVDHEEGRLGHEDFERGLAERLGVHGVEVDPDGLLRRLQRHLVRDDAMVDLVAALRAAGVPVGLVSNSLGRDCYAGYDLPAMFDAIAISGQEGVRKPSRRLYEIGCERLGATPEEVVMVDDLAQNIVAAERLGMAGVVHREAGGTTARLEELLGVSVGGRPPAR